MLHEQSVSSASDICIVTFGLSAFQTIVAYLEFLLPTFGMHSRPNSGIFTARKRSSGKGNVFAPVCHSVHRGGSLYDVTSCLAAWSEVPSGGSLSLVPCSFWGSLCLVLYFLPRVSVRRGVSMKGVSVKGGVHVKGISVKRGSLWPSVMELWLKVVFCYILLVWSSAMTI